ncbi:pyridoxal phosphate-dependent aminotransferase [Lichenibacterium ramalinae]|uniref:Aminotransferase n=1 Tax=Lichenibacterium ramalinae TaxID=2316527 RepID=A0A4Q2R6X6_9HYPH|nr:aminotransferase class I/II-fold pyridoxal phosphate-dependent enzyme [Lichenibacterium ramalinae]RYB01701.1 aminotransferase class I/II-fold pyridoxal phosphate-dependent enzyme [Lichenibacterium ramalinae]
MRFSSLVDRLDAPGGAAWHIHHEARLAAARGEDVILLSVGDPDFDTPAPIVESAVAALRAGDTHYTPIPGRHALRDAVAGLQRRRAGVPTTAENVMIVAGAQNGLFSTALCLLDPGDEVLVMEPIYATYEATLAAAGARVVRVAASPDDGFRPAVAALAGAVTPRTRAILLANPNNPSGVVMTEAEMAAVADVALRHDLWVVADEVYESLVFAGTHRPFRALPGMADRSVTIGSLSKSHAMTGWRIGWAIGPEALIAHMDRLGLNMIYGLPGFVQAAALTAVALYDETAEAMRDAYRARVAVAAEGLAGLPGLAMLRPASGMFALLDVRGTGLTSTDFAWGLFRAEGVSLVDAAAFGPATAGFVRIALAAPEARLAEAFRRIAAYAGRLAG